MIDEREPVAKEKEMTPTIIIRKARIRSSRLLAWRSP